MLPIFLLFANVIEFVRDIVNGDDQNYHSQKRKYIEAVFETEFGVQDGAKYLTKAISERVERNLLANEAISNVFLEQVRYRDDLLQNQVF